MEPNRHCQDWAWPQQEQTQYKHKHTRTHTHAEAASLYNLYKRWGPSMGPASPTNIEFSPQNTDNLAPYSRS